MASSTYIPKLTHAQRAERRLEIAAAVESGKRISEVAIEFGVSSATVVHACAEFGIKGHFPRGRKPGLSNEVIQNRRVSYDEWVNADWSLRDTDLGLQFGVSRERARQVRAALGKDKSPIHHQSSFTIEVRRWIESNRDLVFGKHIIDIAEMCPVRLNRTSIGAILERMQIPFKIGGRQGDGITKENLFSLCDLNERGCWEFKFRNLPTGYACLGGKRYVHRMAYQLFNGAVPDDKWILHHCDNPKCVNPKHLYVGDALDNARDRTVRCRGNSKLTPEQVVEVKRRYAIGGTTMKTLAENNGVSIATIYSIVNEKTWKHLAAQLEWKEQQRAIA